MTLAEVNERKRKKRELLPPPRKGTKQRYVSKPTKKQRLLIKTIKENVGKLPDMPEAQSIEAVNKVINNTVREVYSPTTPPDHVMSQTGVQTLILEGERQGLKDTYIARKFKEGIEDKNNGIKYLTLWTRLKYPEVFRAVNNVDARQVNVYDSLSTDELRRRLEDTSNNNN